jgi:gas vesicle protein
MSQQNQGIGSGTVLLAFVAGAAVGAAVALLFAPASGTETRAYVNRRAREARDRAVLAAEHGREVFNRQRENITTAFDRARQAQRHAGEGEQEA